MFSDLNALIPVLLNTIVVFFVLMLFFRKHIIHLFDPLLYFVVTQAFSIELAFLIIKDLHLLFDFLVCQLFFLFGFFLSVGPALMKKDKQTGIFFKPAKPIDISILKWYACFATILLIIGNLILIKEKGIALLAEDPSTAKTSNFTEGTGLGIVRRMNSGLLYLTGIIFIYLFILKKQLRYALLILLLCTFAAFSGSKSSLLIFVFLTAFFFCFKDLKKNPIVKKLQTGSYFVLLISLFLVGIIIMATNSGSFNDVLLAFGTRFLFYGDAIIYYFNNDSIQHFSNNNFFSFFTDEFNSVFALLRLTSYNQPINFRLINYYFNMPSNDTFGPNVPYYIKGNIYFGFVGGFIYSFIIGCCVGFVRRLFYAIVKNKSSSIILSILIIYLNLIIYSFPQDSLLFFNKIFDIFFLSIPLLGAVYILHLPKVQFNLKPAAIVNV